MPMTAWTQWAASLALAAAVVGLWSAPAAAESPTEVAEQLADDGVFVSRARSDIDEDALIRAVQDVRFDGLRLVAVAPIDPQPDGKSYARRIREVVDADAALLFLDDGTLETAVIEDLSGGRTRATQRARAASDPGRAVLVFAQELTTEPERGRPALVSRLILAVILLAVVISIITVLEQAVRLARARRRADRRVSNNDARSEQSDLVAQSADGRSAN